nr:hypothetical protein [uncultured Allomuricauda sp.]
MYKAKKVNPSPTIRLEIVMYLSNLEFVSDNPVLTKSLGDGAYAFCVLRTKYNVEIRT